MKTDTGKDRRAKRERGSLAVEYALCMCFAGVVMFGVILLYDTMTTDVVDQFKTWVTQYPTH